MSNRSVEELLQSADSTVDFLRGLGVEEFTELPDEYTHWIEEQRAWEESCALMDQSYHMNDLALEGPEALDLLRRVAVNSFEGFEPGQAKQIVAANPNGYHIGDGILFYLDEEKFLIVAAPPITTWVKYHAETGGYDTSADLQWRPVSTDEDPNYFRFQIQGPDALDIAREAVDDSLPDVPFFNFDTVTIDGHSVNALRHGMAGEAGLELFGPYEYGKDVKDALMEEGEEYGIRRVGSQAYQTATLLLGWLALCIPAIFESDEMADYREWLDDKRGIISIGGSFESDDITDYYITPVEIGYDHIINFDHDFIGKEALQEEISDPDRQKVTLVWNKDDVVDLFGSLFEGGEAYQYLELPNPRWASVHYDTVRKDGETIGVATERGYTYNVREMLSLAVVDTEYSEPGTEVTLEWGEPAGSGKWNVERHQQKEIRATVQPAPYTQDRR